MYRSVIGVIEHCVVVMLHQDSCYPVVVQWRIEASLIMRQRR